MHSIEELIIKGHEAGASDVHIAANLPVKFRIDGQLVNLFDEVVTATECENYARELAGEQYDDIRYIGEWDGSDTIGGLRVRINLFRANGHMSASLRILADHIPVLDSLGLPPAVKEFSSWEKGIVLVTGETGSGKSTTLYSILNALNTTERKIITLEDPIEYGIGGISQIPIQTNQGGSFAEGLRSVLRLDPDVVMVGEIRDNDTARTAIQASITGHLVLSSFHANSTSAAFSRMIDMIGVNPIFSSSIRLLIAQRLVRKLADNKEEYKADKATTEYIKRVLDGVDHDYDLDNITLYREVKSEKYPFGFNGRTAIMEQMVVSEEIQKFIRGDVRFTNTEMIEAAAKKEGLLTLEQKGVLAALRGDTTLDEVSRVI